MNKSFSEYVLVVTGAFWQKYQRSMIVGGESEDRLALIREMIAEGFEAERDEVETATQLWEIGAVE